jgi:hypothetical protein
MERAGSPGEMPGATDMAVGQRRVGPLVDAGQVSPALAREDRLAQGYSPKRVDGPYGAEVVWVKDNLGEQTRQRLLREGDAEGAAMTLEEYQNRQKQRSLKRRLMDRAGVTSKDVADADKSVQQLRDLIADTRAASERERIESNRRARMAPRFRNELAFREMGGPDSNEWQNAVAAQRLAPDLRGMTPTVRDAMNMQRAFDLANAALRGGGESPLDMQREMAKEERMRQGRKLAASYMRDSPTAAGGRARAERALAADGYNAVERQEILDDLPFSAPAAGGGAAEPPDPLGHMN